MSELPQGRSLNYEDVEPIEILPVVKSNGVIVYEQLEAVVEKTGIPRAIVGDYGSDIKSGIEKFCSIHNETTYIYDVKHKMASLLKKILQDNARWELFIKLASQAKQQMQQTSIGALAPPAQRSKARYMNTEYLLGWGKNMLAFLSQSDEEIAQMNYDVIKVVEKLGWLREFSDDIDYWSNLIEIATITEDFVRNKGIYCDAEVALIKLFNEKIQFHSDAVLEFKRNVLCFIQNESKKAKPGERLLGSSEIIESVFGKQKFIEKEQSKSGFTGLLLALGSIVSKTTSDVVKLAMESTSTKMIRAWCQKNIKKSVQAKRTEALNLLNKLLTVDDNISHVNTLGLHPNHGARLKTDVSNQLYHQQSDMGAKLEQNGNQLNAA